MMKDNYAVCGRAMKRFRNKGVYQYGLSRARYRRKRYLMRDATSFGWGIVRIGTDDIVLRVRPGVVYK